MEITFVNIFGTNKKKYISINNDIGMKWEDFIKKIFVHVKI